MIKRAIKAIKIVIIVVLISVLSVGTTGFIVTQYLDALLQQFNIPLAVKPSLLSDVWGNRKEDTISTIDDDSAPPDALEVFGDVEEEMIGEEQQEEAVDVEEDELEQSNAQKEFVDSIDETELVFSPEQLGEVKDTIIAEDNDRLFLTLASKIPQESWLAISEMMEDGITEQELTEIQQVLAIHLSKEEYAQMLELLQKYDIE